MSRRSSAAAKRQLGEWGEARAAEHLEASGFRIEARNWRTRHGEIDLIAWSPEGTLCFIEVRTSRSLAFGGALESLTTGKRRRLIAAAEAFTASLAREVPVRFDLIALQERRGSWQVDHVENAFGVS